jgi:hypothetical protein
MRFDIKSRQARIWLSSHCMKQMVGIVIFTFTPRTPIILVYPFRAGTPHQAHIPQLLNFARPILLL